MILFEKKICPNSTFHTVIFIFYFWLSYDVKIEDDVIHRGR